MNSMQLQNRTTWFEYEHSKPEEEILAHIPNTRYYGSKRRLLPWLFRVLERYQYSTVLDLFGGTGTVSLLFQRMNKEVTYNDALACNAICADALLNSSKSPQLICQAKDFIFSVTESIGLISKEFEGLYFLESENRWLDGFLAKYEEQTNRDLRNLVFYGVSQAALMKRPFNLFHRANLNIRTAKVSRSFGNSSTWEKTFQELSIRAIYDIQQCDSLNKVRVLPSIDASLVPSGFDLVYIDPPYVNSSGHTEDYMLRYHFLEGLTNPLSWKSRIDYKKKTKRIHSPNHIRKWSSVLQVAKLFCEILENHKDSIVVLSYVEGAAPSLNEILCMFKKRFRKVDVFERTHFHSMSKSKKTELIIVGIPSSL